MNKNASKNASPLGVPPDLDKNASPLGVPPDLQSGVKKYPNLLMLAADLQSAASKNAIIWVGGLQIPRF